MFVAAYESRLEAQLSELRTKMSKGLEVHAATAVPWVVFALLRVRQASVARIRVLEAELAAAKRGVQA